MYFGAGPGVFRAPPGRFYLVGDEVSSAGALKRVRIDVNRRRSTAIAAISGTRAQSGAPHIAILLARPDPEPAN